MSKNEVRPNQTKTKDVKNFPRPNSKKSLQSFLGLTGYFRKFVKDYAKIARPLSDLLKKDKTFKFGQEQEEAFNMLKAKLADAPILKIFNPISETELHTDASKIGYGALLLQRDPKDNLMHPVSYLSRKTSEAESKKHSYELEVLAVIRALEKCRHFLLGISFTIVTDWNAFRMTMEKKDVAVKIWRWAAMLEDFRYKIEHRSNKQMQHCDALSRYPVTMIREEGIAHRIKQTQQEDAEVRKILTERESDNVQQDYEERNGIVYKLYKGKELLYVPEGLLTEIIKKIHEKGHFAVKKTKETFLQDYWAPKLEERIQQVITSCVPCILVSAKAGRKEGFLNPINKDGGPLHTMHVDHLGPLPASNKNYQHLFVMIDAYTKFVWIFPTKSTTTKEVLEKMSIHQKSFGNPHRLVSDRGTAFTSHEFEDYCKNEGIDHILITTGVPRGNGQVERMNRIIKSVLAKLTIDEPSKWFKHVQPLQRYLNSSFQRSINTSPFELMTGVRMRNKEDYRLNELIEEEDRQELRKYRDELREEAKRQIRKVQEENMKTYNKKRKKASDYQEDELVAIRRTQFTIQSKLKPQFLGPYRIIKKKPKDRYDVERVGPGEPPFRTTTSADNMKRWYVCPYNSYSEHVTENDIIEDDDLVRSGRDVGIIPNAAHEPPPPPMVTRARARRE